MSVELVVGLGNPGQCYADTRHNVGFRVADELVRRHGDSDWIEGSVADLARVAPRMILAKPRSFMNRSGEAVDWLIRNLGLSAANTLIVVDDVDLPLGSLRLRRSGGPGTHNGLRDVCERIGLDFPRLRLGVRGTDPWDDLASYVLSSFEADEESLLTSMIGRAADAVEAVLHDGVESAMNRYNRVENERVGESG
jgi:PTH1 family peptidyl-tRNA hydrolase